MRGACDAKRVPQVVAPRRLSEGTKNDAQALLECEELARHAGDGACQDVLLTLCRRALEEEETTVWDIHRLTGLALHEAFAALRTLEYGRIVRIDDNPSDPFGATIHLRDGGLDSLRRRTAA